MQRFKLPFSWRLLVILVCLLLGLSTIVWRLVHLNVLDRHFLLKQGDARMVRIETMRAHRGMILDRLDAPLAISTPMTSVSMNPRLFVANPDQLKQLAQLLGQTPEQLAALIKRNRSKGFIYLKRRMQPDQAKKIDQLSLAGINTQAEYKRYYPEGSAMAHVVGITNIDDHGQEGMELAYDQWLSGHDGQREVVKDRLGNIVEHVGVLKVPQQGRDLHLTLDHRLQFIAHQALQQVVSLHHADSASIIVLDVKTGEVLVDTNLPTYNPNNRRHSKTGDFRNRALTDTFEPGSTMKPFTIALALMSGDYDAETTVDTNPGRMRVGGYEIKDDGLNYGVINLQQIIEKSSNIGAAKILLSLSPQDFWNLLRSFGFGIKTQSGFPGEVSGRLIAHPVWYPSDVATLAYGYGIAVTTLQLAHAYQILANHGISEPVSFLQHQPAAQGQQVISKQVAQQVMTMLEAVVTKGTGTRAQVRGYRVAGKTGTAYIAGPDGYDKKKFMSSFVGVAPASDPKFVVAVVVRNPQGQHFGSLVAAPVFAKVMSSALRLWSIPPDKTEAAPVS